jgi:hypothetical protein
MSWTDYGSGAVLHEAKMRYLESQERDYKRKMEELMEVATAPIAKGRN